MATPTTEHLPWKRPNKAYSVSLPAVIGQPLSVTTPVLARWQWGQMRIMDSLAWHPLTKADLATATSECSPYCNTESHTQYHSSRRPNSHLVTSQLHWTSSTLEGEQFISVEIHTTHIMGMRLPLMPAWPQPALLSEGSLSI